MTDAPWWGAPLIAAIALLVGATLTLVGTQWRATIEMKRKDQTRWDDLILETAVQVQTICSEISNIGRVGWPQYIEDMRDRTNRYIELVDQLNEAQAKFRLVASDRLRDAALNVFAAAMKEFIGHDETPIKGFEDARKAFVAEVRRELRSN